MKTTEQTRGAANLSTAQAATGRSAESTRNSNVGESKDEVETRIYEIGYLLVPTIAEADVPGEVTVIKDLAEKEKIGILAEEFPKFRALTYPMRKHLGGKWETFTNAYFGWFKFEGTPEGVRRIDKALFQNGNILRYLLIKTVRESTLVGARPPRAETPRVKREVPTGAPTPAPVSEVELDKSIEKLIAE